MKLREIGWKDVDWIQNELSMKVCDSVQHSFDCT
jgi:hypothetical protein